MRNKELFKEKIEMCLGFIFRLIIAYIVAYIFFVVIIDGILEEPLAESVNDISFNLYRWFLTNKNMVIIIYFVIILITVTYRFFSRHINHIDKVYQSLDSILAEDNRELELPNDMMKFSEKLTKINYEYVLSKKNAKESEQKKNDLIMYMAHDLKTPLTSVIGYLTLLNDENKISKELQNKYIKIALDKSLRLEELTNQFFEITRYNLNDMPINKTQLDLSILVDQLIEEFYPMLEDRKLELKVNKPNTLIYNADGDKLARAFGNLLKNAISYSYENTVIEIKMIDNEDNIEVIFRNKGATIPKYKLERIFDKFYRADESRGTNNGGAGLGLAITKEIIELHNGTISVNSENESIEFNINLIK